MKTYKIVFIIIGIVFISCFVYYKLSNASEYKAPFEGESCEEVNHGIFRYDMRNQSDYLRATNAFKEYTLENELKGYCRDGERIGGSF